MEDDELGGHLWYSTSRSISMDILLFVIDIVHFNIYVVGKYTHVLNNQIKRLAVKGR